jgi:hypothetical protein
MFKAGLAFIQFFLQNFFSLLSQLPVKDAFEQLKAFADVTALQLPLAG